MQDILNNTETENKRSVKPIVMMMLLGNHKATEEFHNKIKLQVEEVVPAVVPEVPYTLEKLCGPEFWGQLDRKEKLLAGRCMACMVKNGQLPFEFVGCQHAYPKKYKLKK